MQRDQIATHYIPLRKPALFHDLAKLYIIQHFKFEPVVCSHLLVHAAPDQVKSSYPHVVAAVRIGHLPWPVTKHKQHLEKCQHHAYADTGHDERGK